MANATITQIADAVVGGELNDPTRPWAGTLKARRAYVPLFAEGPGAVPLSTFKDLQALVIPRERPRNELVTRGKFGLKQVNRMQQHRIDIVLQQKPDVGTPEELDATFDVLMRLTEDVEAFLLNDQHPLANFAAARMIDATLNPFPAIDYARIGIFTSVIQGIFEAYL